MAERMGPETVVKPAQLAELTADARPEERASNLELVMDIEVPVTVELGQASVRIEDLLALHVGAVLELDRRAGDAVDILVNGQPIARGEVVVVDDAFGVRITSIAEPAQRVRSLNARGASAA